MCNESISIESMIANEEKYNLELSGLLATEGLNSGPVDKALSLMGCKTSTALRADISNEGLGQWIVDHVTNFVRRKIVFWNVIISYITWADKRTKELIFKAENDPNVKLPISGIGLIALNALWMAAAKRIGTRNAAIGVLVGGAAIGVSRKLFSSKSVADVEAVEKLETKVKDSRAGSVEGKELVKGLKDLRGNFARMSTVANKAKSVEIDVPKRIKDFANKHEDDSKIKTTLWEKIKNISTWFKDTMKMIWICIKSLPSKLKGNKVSTTQMAQKEATDKATRTATQTFQS